jgi:hypothetical protein
METYIYRKIGKKRLALLIFKCLHERQLYHVGKGLREPVEIRLVLLVLSKLVLLEVDA